MLINSYKQKNVNKLFSEMENNSIICVNTHNLHSVSRDNIHFLLYPDADFQKIFLSEL